MNRLTKLLAIFAVLILFNNTSYADTVFQPTDDNDPLAGCDACFEDLKPKEKKKLPKKPNKDKKKPPKATLNKTIGRVLIFGDSHSHIGADSDPNQININTTVHGGSIGAHIANLLLEHHYAVRVDARVGRSAYNFWKREDASSIIANDKDWNPSCVLIILGTNDAGLSIAATKIAFERLRDAYGEANIIVIGPPAFTDTVLNDNASKVTKLLQAMFGDSFINLQVPTTGIPYTDRTRDRIHFTSIGAQHVIEKIGNTILNRLNA